MPSWMRSKHYEAGIKAAWESLNPHEQDACFNAWMEYGSHLPDSEAERLGDRITIDFAWGFQWGANRFRDDWIGLAPEKRIAFSRKARPATIADLSG